MDSYTKFNNATFVWNRKMLAFVGHDIYDKDFTPHIGSYAMRLIVAVIGLLICYNLVFFDNFTRLNCLFYFCLFIQVNINIFVWFEESLIYAMQCILVIFRPVLKSTMLATVWIFWEWFRSSSSYLKSIFRVNQESVYCYSSILHFIVIWFSKWAWWCMVDHRLCFLYLRSMRIFLKIGLSH